MRIVAIRERTVPISRYEDPALPTGGLTTSIVRVETDIRRGGEPVVGYGFASFGRFGQGGLIRERFAPRLLQASASDIADGDGNLDPLRGWHVMMAGEKPGGHGERCVAVGTLDMALWDAAAKAASLPLNLYLAAKLGREQPERARVHVYASGGYPYPERDAARLREEIERIRDLGYTRVKIKIGSRPATEDLKRLDVVLAQLPAGNVAVDAMNAYDRTGALKMATALRDRGLWWFEDVVDPLDLETLAELARVYPSPLAAGEALFSLAEARLLHRHGGLRPTQDILVFDPVHCYGLPEYLRIVETLEGLGWPRRAFWPHGGHLFSLHIAAALGLGGAEINPFSFAPFGGLADGAKPADGYAEPPAAPGVGFESKASLMKIFGSL